MTQSFTSIYDHTLDVISGSLFVVGGMQQNRPSVNVWRSDDAGSNWYVCGYLAEGRAQHASIIFTLGLVIVGGFSSEAVKNDVLLSTDASHFYLQTDAAPWSPRTYPRIQIIRDRLVLVGGWLASGFAAVDVWSTFDLVSWTLMTTATPYQPRVGFVLYSTILYNLVVMGGITESGTSYPQDQWISGDTGRTWQLRSANSKSCTWCTFAFTIRTKSLVCFNKIEYRRCICCRW